MSGHFLRYRRDIDDGVRFARLRYPAHRDVTAEQAEAMRQAMPDPDRFEITSTHPEETDQ